MHELVSVPVRDRGADQRSERDQRASVDVHRIRFDTFCLVFELPDVRRHVRVMRVAAADDSGDLFDAPRKWL